MAGAPDPNMALFNAEQRKAQQQKVAPPPVNPNMPPLGAMQGQVVLNPSIAPKVNGNARPLAMGEYVKNPSGSTSNEISVTVTDPILNNGAPTIVPSLWVINGVPTRVDEDTAAKLAAQSGLQFQSFKTPEEAEKFATQREATWQNTDPSAAGQVQALWKAMTDSGRR
jgi:hypothetical protein